MGLNLDSSQTETLGQLPLLELSFLRCKLGMVPAA